MLKNLFFDLFSTYFPDFQKTYFLTYFLIVSGFNLASSRFPDPV